MVDIHLYGKLRRLVPDAKVTEQTVLLLEAKSGETILALLERAGVPIDELHHIFLNGRLFATHNTMAPWLRYPQAQADVWNWDTKMPVNDGDRLGLFGDDMATLVV